MLRWVFQMGLVPQLMSDAMELLHSKVKDLVADRKWKLTAIQKASIPSLVDGLDRLLIAPTGSGKTEAAILPLTSRLLSEEWGGLSILYITPLRALNRDIDRRLSEMLSSLGLEVGVRHGDTSAKERLRQSRKPPNLLVTTPETAQIMLLGSRLRKHLSGVKSIILDEVHEMASSERGSQMLVGLERIKSLSNRPIQMVGLSATVGNPIEVANWFSKDSEPIIGSSPRITDVLVHREPASRDDELLSQEWSVSPNSVAAFRRLALEIAEESPSLVFVNSRSTAETVSQRLISLAPNLNIGVHHGSLAAETRKDMENSLQKGELDGLICTSSLELGIDVGSVRRVHQLQSPRSVERLLQRVGRAEHRVGGAGRGSILAWDVDEIAECAVISRRAIAGELEGVEWRKNPRIVAANQFMQMAIERTVVPLKMATEIIQRCSIFTEWRHQDTLDVLRVLSSRWMLKLVENPVSSDPTEWPSKLWKELSQRVGDGVPQDRPKWDEEIDEGEKEIWKGQLIGVLPNSLKEGWFSPSGRLGKTRSEHFSMIPDEVSYRVRDLVSSRVIGSVDEAFVLSLGEESRGFVMAGRTWEVIDADPDSEELVVSPIKEHGSAPIWSGELPPVPMSIAREVGKLRRAVYKSLLVEECEVDLSEYPLSDEAMSYLVSSVVEHHETSGAIPDDLTITIEQRNDSVTVNTCTGSRINETLGHFLQAMGSLKEGKMGRTVIDPYRVTVQVPGTRAGDIIEWLNGTPPQALESILRMTIPNGRSIRWRMVQVAKKMGVLRKGIDPRKVNIEGMMERYRGTSVVEDSLDKLFHERMDIDSTTDLLNKLQNGSINLRFTPPGRLGMPVSVEKDLLLPSWSDKELRERVESRLLNERVVMICLNCRGKSRKRVGAMNEEVQACTSCGGEMQACAAERIENLLTEWISSKDPKISLRMSKNAELVRFFGFEAVMCLMGRGVGEDTAARILRSHKRGDRVELLRSIQQAELKYARTRRFW